MIPSPMEGEGEGEGNSALCPVHYAVQDYALCLPTLSTARQAQAGLMRFY
jgi:hypothetical protein